MPEQINCYICNTQMKFIEVVDIHLLKGETEKYECPECKEVIYRPVGIRARIISEPYGGGEKRVSDTIYKVILKEKDRNKLIVGKNYNGKPVIMTYKDSELLFLD